MQELSKVTPKISLVMVDDHPLFRQGVVNALSLEPDMDVVAQTDNGDDALEVIRQLRPQVALVDIGLPGLNGLQVAHLARQERLPTRVVLLTGYDEVEQAFHAALAGAAGYLSKDVDARQLAETIRRVAAGEFVFGQRSFTAGELEEWVNAQVNMVRRSYSEPGLPFHPLSSREMDVLYCMVRGMSNKEIAALLGISQQTVKNHVTSILRKFCVQDRTQAVIYAFKHGLVKRENTELRSSDKHE